jgi:hypothetical protein
MVILHRKIWASLLAVAFVLMSLRIFAPLPNMLDKVLGWLAVAIWLSYASSYFWQDRRERQADQSNSAAISSSDQR